MPRFCVNEEPIKLERFTHLSEIERKEIFLSGAVVAEVDDTVTAWLWGLFPFPVKLLRFEKPTGAVFARERLDSAIIWLSPQRTLEYIQ